VVFFRQRELGSDTTLFKGSLVSGRGSAPIRNRGGDVSLGDFSFATVSADSVHLLRTAILVRDTESPLN
jgi:hypothetical protein